MLRLSYAGACFTVLFATVGCGKMGLVPVKGTVKLDGQPLPNASVMFIAQDEGGMDAIGYTDANGVFRLSSRNEEGAMRGTYKVVVQASARSGDAPSNSKDEAQKHIAEAKTSAKSLVPARFSQPDQTILVQTIPANGDIVLELTSE